MEIVTLPPALYNHCETVYSAMWAQAESRKVDGADVIMWEGSGTKLFRDLMLSVPYYSKVMRALQGMDCVRQLRRGGGGAPSQWLLMQKPTRELFDTLPPESPKSQEQTAQQQQLKDLNRRLIRLERAVFDRDGGVP